MGAAAEGMPRKRRPRDGMSFPDDLVRYLFGHLRASPARSHPRLSYRHLRGSRSRDYLPGNAWHNVASSSYALLPSLARFTFPLHSARSSLCRFTGFPRFPPLHLSLHGNVNFSFLFSPPPFRLLSPLPISSIQIFETESHELFLKEILVIFFLILLRIYRYFETRIANVILCLSLKQAANVIRNTNTDMLIHVSSN